MSDRRRADAFRAAEGAQLRCPGAGIPLDWGRREYVEELLGDPFDLRYENRVSTLAVGSTEEHWQFFVANLGPLTALAESLDDELPHLLVLGTRR